MSTLKICLSGIVFGAFLGLYLLGVPKIARVFSINTLTGYAVTLIPWAIIVTSVETIFKARKEDYTFLKKILWLVSTFPGSLLISFLLNLLTGSV